MSTAATAKKNARLARIVSTYEPGLLAFEGTTPTKESSTNPALKESFK
jgi:hypothetical protein